MLVLTTFPAVQPPQQCAKNIENLAQCIKQKFPNACIKIGLSGITIRDDLDLKERIAMVNEELEKNVLQGRLCPIKIILITLV